MQSRWPRCSGEVCILCCACIQTQVDPVELELLIQAATEDSGDPAVICYEAFVTKMMSV
jgi:hypothetical protein